MQQQSHYRVEETLPLHLDSTTGSEQRTPETDGYSVRDDGTGGSISAKVSDSTRNRGNSDNATDEEEQIIFDNLGDSEDEAKEKTDDAEEEDKPAPIDYEEPTSECMKKVALLSNPFYNAFLWNRRKARALVIIRGAFVFISIVGAYIEVGETMKSNCFVYSPVGAFENLPQNWRWDAFFGLMFTPRTILCSEGNFDKNLERAMKEPKCSLVGYNASSFFDSNKLNISFLNFEKRATEPYDVELSPLNISQSQCLGLNHTISPEANLVDIKEKDKCGLTAWVSGEDVGPALSLLFTVTATMTFSLYSTFAVELVMVNMILKRDYDTEHRFGRWLTNWKNRNIAAVPTMVNVLRLFSSNIWFIPFVTLSPVDKCPNFSTIQASLPLALLIALVSVVLFLYVRCPVLLACCPCKRTKLLITLALIGGTLILCQYFVYLLDNWGYITSLLTNMSIQDFTGSSGLTGARRAGQILLRIGGWVSGIWDIKELLESSCKVAVQHAQK